MAFTPSWGEAGNRRRASCFKPFQEKESRNEPPERLVSASSGQAAAFSGAVDLPTNELLVGFEFAQEIRERADWHFAVCHCGGVRYRADSGAVCTTNDSDGLCAHRSSSSLDREG